VKTVTAAGSTTQPPGLDNFDYRAMTLSGFFNSLWNTLVGPRDLGAGGHPNRGAGRKRRDLGHSSRQGQVTRHSRGLRPGPDSFGTGLATDLTLPSARAPVAQWIEQRFPKPCGAERSSGRAHLHSLVTYRRSALRTLRSARTPI
jgi:hypothetical protein